MAQEVSIYQLLGACTALDIQFSSDNDDNVEDSDDTQHKLELARQSEAELEDPHSTWNRLETAIERRVAFVEDAVKAIEIAKTVGQNAAENARDDQGYEAWSALLAADPIQKRMQILSSEVKQKGHVIGGISAALEHVREQHTDCDTKIKQLEGELSQWKKDHTHCSTQGATIADLEGELSQWKKDHTHCSTQSTTIARLEDEYQRVREQHRNCSTQGATIARLEGEYQRFREQHRNCSTQSTTIARLEGEYQRFREQHRNCSTQSATTTSLQQKLRDLGPSNRECSNQSDTATKLIGQAHGRQINGKRTEETVSIRRRTDATPQLMGEVDVHRATTVPDTTMASVSRIEASLKSVYMLASLCLAKGAERTDNPVSAKYKALEELVLKWGTSDIRGDYTDATRSASFVDLYRDLAVGFEKLAMSHMTQARDLQNMASKVVQLRADVFDLKADRDEWKRHCLAVLTKAESEQKAAHGRESALKEQLKGMAEFIGELQRLLGDDDNQKLLN
ncbi:hypothetical protein HBI56_020830 [Parastagonospora nodorum]|nr:hypothetical protein HBH56_173800 [Parastagonospora nodorum]KAH3926355.1 hypothetical protein HBH54_169300 [Parastagonospora nodorum]KAH3982222.1 hypothetical protein HBH52_074760 [Parastagonospora nodorum]KAH4007548.1 hypothetical protein HBI10_007820 [Parastagonospora nodorum]KAH4023524.1 hypothetical protein HBI13_089530 [Parastagonospora nodorum]